MNEMNPAIQNGRRGLGGQFFWRPRGFVRSVAEFHGGPVVDVKSRLTPVPLDDHPLVVAELPGGKIIGDTVLVATADDEVIGGMQGLSMCAEQKDNWLLRRRRFRFPKRKRGTALMLSMNGDNYFHWCFESLPRWELLDTAGWNIARADWVLLSHNATAYQEQMLEKLGVPRQKWLRCSKWETLQFDRLVVPSMPVPKGMLINAWVCNFLRKSFLLPNIPPPTEKIYLSRRGIRRRRIVNELELEHQLRRRGFRIFAPQTMSVAQQAGLFASAKVVVAPHSAGLSNLVFCEPGALLIELMHPGFPVKCYERLAEARGVHYRKVMVRDVSSAGSKDDREAESEVDVEEILRAVPAEFMN